MKFNHIEKIIGIPEDVQASLEDDVLKVKGPKGIVERAIKSPRINIAIKEKTITIKIKKATRKEKRTINTTSAHIYNLIKGVQEGFVYKLKICSGHFPMQVSISGNDVIINNFLGEKIPRKAKILGNVKVKIEKEIITVEGIDKEKTAQTAANIEMATRITNRDRRVFQDGCFIIEKEGSQIK